SPADGVSCSAADNTANYGSGTPVSLIDDGAGCGTSYGTDDGSFSCFAHSLFLLSLSGSGRSVSCISGRCIVYVNGFPYHISSHRCCGCLSGFCHRFDAVSFSLGFVSDFFLFNSESLFFYFNLSLLKFHLLLLQALFGYLIVFSTGGQH